MGGNNFGVSHKYLLSLYVNSLIKDGGAFITVLCITVVSERIL